MTERGFDVDGLLEERSQIEIEDVGSFLDLARRYDAELYMCSDPHLNFDVDGIIFYVDADCGIQDHLAEHNIKFKLI